MWITVPLRFVQIVGGGVIPKVMANDERGKTMEHDYKRLKKTIENANLKEVEIKSLDLYNQKASETANTLTMPNHNDQRLFDGKRVRKLTPRECWRLMGVRDEDFDKVKDSFSDSLLYHLAGDSIVVDVLMNLFSQMME